MFIVLNTVIVLNSEMINKFNMYHNSFYFLASWYLYMYVCVCAYCNAHTFAYTYIYTDFYQNCLRLSETIHLNHREYFTKVFFYWLRFSPVSKPVLWKCIFSALILCLFYKFTLAFNFSWTQRCKLMKTILMTSHLH